MTDTDKMAVTVKIKFDDVLQALVDGNTHKAKKRVLIALLEECGAIKVTIDGDARLSDTFTAGDYWLLGRSDG